MRRGGGIGSVDLTELTADIPIPQQHDNVWTSPTNKTNLQRLVRQLVSTPELVPLTVVLSGCMMDEGCVPAQLLRSADPSLSHHSDPTYADIT